LRLIISLSHEASGAVTVGHEFCFGRAETEVENVGYVFPAIVVSFFISKLSCCRGLVSSAVRAGGRQELFDENFDNLEGRVDDRVLIGSC